MTKNLWLKSDLNLYSRKPFFPMYYFFHEGQCEKFLLALAV